MHETPYVLVSGCAGYRMQLFDKQVLLTPIDDVWAKIGGILNDANKNLSKGFDGKYYFVPIYNYPWVVWYNKSEFQSKVYTVPTTWDDSPTPRNQMPTAGLTPLEFAPKDLWRPLALLDSIARGSTGHTSSSTC